MFFIRMDRMSKGGGVAIYVKSEFKFSRLPKPNILNCFRLKWTYITVVSCYRPPSASGDALNSLYDVLHKLHDSEFIILGDLDWDMLTSVLDSFKELCDSLNLALLINAPTRPNPRAPNKSKLLDIILNTPHIYTSTGIFCNDVSDHCACVWNTKMTKAKPR